jgi:carboxymethylenebutenolidase
MTSERAQSAAPYVALPPAGNGPGVLVLHAWWGRNDFVKSFCDRLSGEGFVVAAPDMFEGDVATTIDDAATISQKHEQTRQAEIAALITRNAQQLANHPAVTSSAIGVVGFSFGASWSYWLAQQAQLSIAAVVTFYGSGEGDFTNSRAAFLAHYAANDEYEPEEYAIGLKESLDAAGKSVEFHTYPDTTHWFFESDRADAYTAEAAELAWQRTVQFLRTNLT